MGYLQPLRTSLPSFLPSPLHWVRRSIRARALERAGFVLRRQTGSHAIYRHPSGRTANVPMHTGDIPAGTLRSILRMADLPPEQLRELL